MKAELEMEQNSQQKFPEPPEYGRRHVSKDKQSKLGKLWRLRGGAPRRHGINTKPWRDARVSDVVIVSEEAVGQNNRARSQGPLDEQTQLDREHVRMGRKS